jgi:hypothetical protein
MARTKNSLPHMASLGSAGEMSITILAERKYLRTERQADRRPVDPPRRPPAVYLVRRRLFLEASEFAQNSPADVPSTEGLRTFSLLSTLVFRT